MFKEQIANGGPVTLTDHEVTRYFMTIPEAARLVLLSGAFAEGGDVFLLDMGKPVKISNLARQMIEMSGLSVRDGDTPDGDIEIVEVGLRPGEKLYEELLIGGDTLPTPHPKILRARESSLSGRQLNAMLKAVQTAISASDPGKIRKLVTRYVSEYQPPSNGAG